MGDFLVTLPACRALRERWPEARIECLGYPRTTVLGEGRFYFDAVRSLDRSGVAGFFAGEAAILDPDWADWFSEFDLVVSWLYDPAETLAGNLRRCGVPEVWAAAPQVPAGFGRPAARHFLDALPFETAGIDLQGRLFPTGADRAAAGALWPGNRFVALHPGSGSPAKNWPVGHWAAVLEALRERQVPVILVGGEADRPALDRLAPLAAATVRERPLPEVAALLSRAALFLGHDSGVTHLAAAAGAPVVALFGPTDPAIWAPPGEKVRVLAAGQGLDALSPAEVLREVERALG